MGRQFPQLVNINEAVGILVNMHTYIDEEYSLFEILEAFKEDAEVEYENAAAEGVPSKVKHSLKMRMLACDNRHQLARHLEESLKYEIRHPDQSYLEISADDTGKPRITWESLSDWAANQFGIEIYPPEPASPKESPKEKVAWEKVTIKIWSDYQIGYSVDGSTYKRKYFSQIGLMDSRKKKPNKLGSILIGLSMGKKFGVSKKNIARDKTAMTRLRQLLMRWVGGSEDPFKGHNEADGWVPKFELIDDHRSIEERAKEEGQKLSDPLDPNADYEKIKQ